MNKSYHSQLFAGPGSYSKLIKFYCCYQFAVLKPLHFNNEFQTLDIIVVSNVQKFDDCICESAICTIATTNSIVALFVWLATSAFQI